MVVTYENTGGGGQLQLLDSGRIHHNPHPLAHGLWWQVLGELCSDRPSVAMRSGHLAPNDSKVGLLSLWLSGDRSLVLGPVDVCASLADVPGGIVLAFAALDFEESGVFVLVPESALEPSEHRLGVKPSGLDHFRRQTRRQRLQLRPGRRSIMKYVAKLFLHSGDLSNRHKHSPVSP